MQRYNIFYQIHKALRQMLYHAASLQLQTDFTNATDTRILLKQMNTVLELFDEHAHTEDNSVLSSIIAFNHLQLTCLKKSTCRIMH